MPEFPSASSRAGFPSSWSQAFPNGEVDLSSSEFLATDEESTEISRMLRVEGRSEREEEKEGGGGEGERVISERVGLTLRRRAHARASCK